MHYYTLLFIKLIFVKMENDEVYRFKFQDEQLWRKHLNQQGFVVIANWLPQEECLKYVAQFWEIMEILSDGTLDRNKPETQILSKSYPPVLHGGMIQYVGHSKPQWQLRKKAKPLFQKLWQTDYVKTSFDGFCFMNGNRNYQDNPINSFLHCDQSPTINKIWSYQGVQCLTTTGQKQGGFVVVPKSNHYHRKYFQQKEMLGHKSNWYLVPPKDKEDEESLFYDKKCLKVNTKAGDFILWDSRTFHCNTVPRVKTLRICTYICMLPQSHISEKTRELRKLAAKNNRVSNHHPGDGFKTFPVFPRYLTNQNRFQQLLTKVNSTVFDEQMKDLL